MRRIEGTPLFAIIQLIVLHGWVLCINSTTTKVCIEVPLGRDLDLSYNNVMEASGRIIETKVTLGAIFAVYIE